MELKHAPVGIFILAIFAIVFISGCIQSQKAQLDADNFNFDLYTGECSPDGKTASPNPGIELLLSEGQLFDIDCTLKINGEIVSILEIYRSLPKTERVEGKPTTQKVESIDQSGRYYLHHNQSITADQDHEFVVCCNGFCDTETVNASCWYQRTH